MINSSEFIWLEHNGSYKFNFYMICFFNILMSFAAFLENGISVRCHFINDMWHTFIDWCFIDFYLGWFHKESLIPITSQTGSWFVSYWEKIDNIYDKIDDTA